MPLFFLFILIPVIEIALFIKVGGLIGLWPTIALVLLSAVIGSVLIRSQGSRTLIEVQQSFRTLNDPTRPLAHGLMIVIAGMLLLTPGFFTDALGLLLLIPPVRSAIYAFLKSRVTVVTTATGAGPGFTQRRVDDGTIDLDSDEWRPR